MSVQSVVAGTLHYLFQISGIGNGQQRAQAVVIVDADTGLPAAIGGGSGGGSTTVNTNTAFAYTDDTGTQFMYRASSATPPVVSAYVIGTGAAYTVGANPRPFATAGVGFTSDVSATTDTGTFSLIALTKRLLTKLTAGLSVVFINPAAILTGQATVGTAVAALGAGALVNGVVITASSANTATIYVGPAGVTTANGYPLVAGQSISFGVTNLSGIYAISGTAAQAAFYAGS